MFSVPPLVVLSGPSSDCVRAVLMIGLGLMALVCQQYDNLKCAVVFLTWIKWVCIPIDLCGKAKHVLCDQKPIDTGL